MKCNFFAVPVLLISCCLADSGGLAVSDKEKATFLSGTATSAPPSGHQPDVCSNLSVTFFGDIADSGDSCFHIEW
jgi:hypothetical protein